MKKVLVCFSLAALLAMGGQAFAEICTIDDVPAATLLLPYFEVNLGNTTGVTTLFSVNNASAAAAIAHVTLWTDWSIPTLDFDVYLTGYDVQTFNIRDIFDGKVPITADRGVDAGLGDAISPSPPLGSGQSANVNPFTGPFTPGVPTEFDFPSPPSTSGPCVQIYASPVLDGSRIAALRNAHTGKNAPAYGGCVGATYGDNIARGYITVDSVTQCNLLFPSSATYFSGGIADVRNILWGDYFYVNGGENFAQGETLVHIESCNTPPVVGTTAPFIGFVGNGGRRPTGAPWCPFAPGEYTFYGRYTALAGQDQREPLSTTFAARYLNGGTFTGGTDMVIWRDSKTIPTGANGAQTCGNTPAWFPLNQGDVVAFDEQENPQNLCVVTSDVSPPPTDQPTCFPLETQRASVNGGNIIGTDFTPTAPFGWLYLNLNTTVTGVTYPSVSTFINPPSIAQAWVTAVMDASGRFSVGFDAIQLDSACQPSNVVFLSP